MSTWTLFDTDFRKLPGRTKYNTNGFLLCEYGRSFQHHFRFDLESEGGKKQIYMSGGYKYLVHTIHVKVEVGERRYVYVYAHYQGGGVWQQGRKYAKSEAYFKDDTPDTWSDATESQYSEAIEDLHWLMRILSEIDGKTKHALATGYV